VDDFDGRDLIAIGRLIHHAGMLGRKVMISSATIAPDLALGFFNAYQAYNNCLDFLLFKTVSKP
jgi:CRISPR-associated endonuclease/helicase Cas3